MNMKKKVPPKVSGLVQKGKINFVDQSITERLPDFVNIDSFDETSFPTAFSGNVTQTNVTQETDISAHSLHNDNDLASQTKSNQDFILRPDEIVQQLSIDKIKRSPYQPKNRLDEAHVADLAENMRNDGLHQPILVRPIRNGEYELIAGEHRLEACKLNGLQAISCIVRKMDDNQAARALLFENLFHRALSDFQIYQGFKLLLKMGAIQSVRALARETGYSTTQIQRLLSFDHFSEKIHDLLNNHHNLIGANAAEALAKHCKNGRGDLVFDALSLIRDGKLTQVRASAWIETRFTTKPPRTSRVLTRGYHGQEFCTLTRDGNQIKIRIAPDIDSSELEEALYETLRLKAAQVASEKREQ
ncbi:ParB/RepB/Spo0J family partition protein [Nitrosomonas sp. Nm132]|uniref:ParB/RepB/Spo0J family partition protein n=1 Tax=Nitrosomonas sp. Nm132 TaxID=1881053 RepID=UPI000892362A|nr:ParB/RepB/Spo0J family partition protein [Nitrosomonas sp. Nm132]SDH45545.1 chromosome partitioning protein, ParB family [Nitrosomonas sp. Nm132]